MASSHWADQPNSEYVEGLENSIAQLEQENADLYEIVAEAREILAGADFTRQEDEWDASAWVAQVDLFTQLPRP